MIHYHGVTLGPNDVAAQCLRGGHGFVSYAQAGQLGIVAEMCQSFAIDNGAFSAWNSGAPVTDWDPYYAWAQSVRRLPNCDFGVIPDVIDGSEEDNDALISRYSWDPAFFAPVWHMHERLERLGALAGKFHRVCIGSSGAFSRPGTDIWWRRMQDVMRYICDQDGYPKVRLHGLRMLSPSIFQRLPLSSADSTNVGRTVNMEKGSRGIYAPLSKAVRAMVLRSNIEHFNAPPRWGESTIRTHRVRLIP